MKIDSILQSVTTLLLVSTPSLSASGTGFFYQEPGLENLAENEGWRNIDRLWVVTNRHVVLPQVGGKETLPDSFVFQLRHLAADGQLEWDPIVLDQNELLTRLKLHPDPNVDVAAVEVLELVKERVESRGDYLAWYGISEKQLPDNRKMSIEVADDALVVGYPRGFYDRQNLFPVVKSGIVASRWNAHFNGEPYFLIDAKLFPGSSGSLVISKPHYSFASGEDVIVSDKKEFAFLGIFSGEPIQEHAPVELEDITIIRRAGYNVGVVWYGQLVSATITSGVSYK